MKLIAGLGNPGKAYKNNRHNIGSMVVDALCAKYGVKLKKKLFKRLRYATFCILKEPVAVIQPLTFMNLSGPCIANFCREKKIAFSDTMVICDDVNLFLPKIRIRPSGSAGGHKGLLSIIESLGSKDFPRLRIGIAAKDKKMPDDLAQYVLSNFKDDEKALLGGATETAVSACECWIKEGVESAMNKFN